VTFPPSYVFHKEALSFVQPRSPRSPRNHPTLASFPCPASPWDVYPLRMNPHGEDLAFFNLWEAPRALRTFPPLSSGHELSSNLLPFPSLLLIRVLISPFGSFATRPPFFPNPWMIFSPQHFFFLPTTLVFPAPALWPCEKSPFFFPGAFLEDSFLCFFPLTPPLLPVGDEFASCIILVEVLWRCGFVPRFIFFFPRIFPL